MSRRSDLEAAVKKQDAAIARLKSVKKPNLGQLQSLVTNLETQNKQLRELATLPPDGPTTPNGPTPPTSGDAAARSKAWNHAAARDEINEKLLELNRQGIADPKAQIEALGPELAGKALALGKFGSPYGPSSNNPDLPWDLADAWGGYWNIEQGGSDADAYANLWKASELVKTVRAEPGVPIQNNQQLGRDNGYNADNDGPA